MDLLPCPKCGVVPVLDWSGTTEFTWGGYQTCDVTCMTDKCSTAVNIEVCTDDLKIYGNIGQATENAWNAIAKTKE